jgi:uncharacterized protein
MILTIIWRDKIYTSPNWVIFAFIWRTMIEKIAGRKREIALMQGLLTKPRSAFVAMYGRRRIGKTFLIRELYADLIKFECSGLHNRSTAFQLEHFYNTLQETGAFQSGEVPQPKTWLQAFSLLKSYINSLPPGDKKVIFLDEISWFDTPRSGFLATLDSFWNQYCTKRDDIILVICGSAASWIIQKVVNDRGGLHNRITQHIPLQPFTLHETRAYLHQQGITLTNRDVLMLYMCVGGVPFYLNDLTAGHSVPQILDSLFFGTGARLRNEFRNLYAALFKNYEIHEKVVAALATKNKGLTRSDIIAASGIASGGGLTTVLEELIACGFVQRVLPMGKKHDDALFRLIDEFTLFYYQFIRHAPEQTSWSQVCATQSWHICCGFAFESICLKHIAQIKQALGISGIITNTHAWQSRGTKTEKGVQIDMLIDRADNCINIIEAKYQTASFDMTQSTAAQLSEKVQGFIQQTKTKKNVFVTLISVSGAKRNEHFLSVVTNEIDVEALFCE